MRIKALIFLFIVVGVQVFGQNSLTVMYYNLLNFPRNTPERADTLRRILQYVKPDVLVVNELVSEAGADLILQKSINVGKVSHYSRARFTDGKDSDNMIFYNAKKLGLKGQMVIPTDLRHINGYTLYVMPVLGDTVFLNFFSAHLKASTGNEEMALRALEASQLKAYLGSNPQLQNVVFGGDLNLYSSSEPAYTVLSGGYHIRLMDPIFTPGDWSNNPRFSHIHTQSVRKTQFGGGSTGGLDDRFDMVFLSSDIMYGEQFIQYQKDSYKALGQDGNRFDHSIIDPPNHSAPDSVITALYHMSDHMPVLLTLDILKTPSSQTSTFNPREKLKVEPGLSGLAIECFAEKLTLTLVTADNKLVLKRTLSKGKNKIEMNSKLPDGVYEVNVKNASNSIIFSEKLYLKNKPKA